MTDTSGAGSAGETAKQARAGTGAQLGRADRQKAGRGSKVCPGHSKTCVACLHALVNEDEMNKGSAASVRGLDRMRALKKGEQVELVTSLCKTVHPVSWSSSRSGGSAVAAEGSNAGAAGQGSARMERRYGHGQERRRVGLGCQFGAAMPHRTARRDIKGLAPWGKGGALLQHPLSQGSLPRPCQLAQLARRQHGHPARGERPAEAATVQGPSMAGAQP